MRRLVFALLFLLSSLTAHARPFTWGRDNFAFPNETLWSYEIVGGELRIQPRTDHPTYTQRCLVLIRAAKQFRNFAKFEPAAPRLSEAGYRERVRKLARIPVWSKRPQRLEFPGFADLHAFSAAYPEMLQAELGDWWPTYFRPGNWRMPLPFPRANQRWLADRFAAALARGETPAAFLTRFKPMNHAVLLFASRRNSTGDLVFTAYDPNNVARPVTLRFEEKSGNFLWEKTPYFPGGVVNVFEIYRSWWQ